MRERWNRKEEELIPKLERPQNAPDNLDIAHNNVVSPVKIGKEPRGAALPST